MVIRLNSRRGFDKAKDIDIGIIWNLECKFKKKVEVIPLDWIKEKKIFLKYVKKGERIK